MLRLAFGDQKIRAAVTLPGSKSISNRMLLLKEVLGEETELQRISESDDTSILAQALHVIASGDSATIDIGQAGTDMRFLTAYLATRPGQWLLTGSERMKQRPLAPLVDALRQLGARISYVEKEGFPPLRIEGTELGGGQVTIDGRVSSQFISALLLVSPLLKTPLTVTITGRTVSKPYITMTLALMRLYGCASRYENDTITAGRRRTKHLRSYEVEGDWAAASYYYSLCALAPDVRLELRYLYRKSLQADAAVAAIFEKLGVHTVYRASSVLISRQGEVAASFEHDFTDCPDLAQTVAVACFGLGVPARLTGLRTLRIKETDRVQALAEELSRLGADVETGEESLTITGKADAVQNTHPVISTYGDHRMALSFAPLVARYGEIHFEDGDVVRKSYPGFWQDLQALGFTVILQP